MNETDIVLLTVFSLAFFAGYLKGLLKTILGPISLFLGTIVAWFVHIQYNNIPLSLVVGLFGPFVIRLFLSLICKAFIKTFTADEGKNMSTLSRVLGGFFSIMWSGSLFTIFILLLTVVPIKINQVTNIQTNIKESEIISYLSSLLNVKNENPITALTNIADIIKNPEHAKAARETQGYKELTKTPTVKDIMRDKETLKQIEEKNVPALLKNEKIQNLLKDPDAIEKIFAFQKELMSLSTDKKG